MRYSVYMKRGSFGEESVVVDVEADNYKQAAEKACGVTHRPTRVLGECGNAYRLFDVSKGKFYWLEDFFE